MVEVLDDLAVTFLAGMLLACVVLILHGRRARPSLFTIQSEIADAADVPVDKTSAVLKALRARPDLLKRLLDFPVDEASDRV